MGCATVKPPANEEENINNKLEEELKKQKESVSKILKLLLLGTGESGKSTIFKQMQILYDRGFSENEVTSFRGIIRRNVVESIQNLISGVSKFELKFHHKLSEQYAQFLQDYDMVDTQDNGVEDIQLVSAIKHLWKNEPAIKEVYQRKSKIQLMDSAHYFLEKIDQIASSNFTPTKDDILRARARTSGIIEKKFVVGNVEFKFIDVGGQRNERRKWIHSFDDVTAIIFVTAISEFDQQLYEDEKVNRLQESLNVFDQVINNQYFATSTIILFLNKTDLFTDKLRNGIQLIEYFRDYNGDNTFEDASSFIKDKFIAFSENKNRFVFPHLTCATDTKNFQRVFDACKLTILSNNLEKLGLS